MPVIQPPPLTKGHGLRAALFGDSITGYNIFCNPPLTSFNNQYNPSATEIDFGQAGFFSAYNALAGHPFDHDPAQNHGVPGNTSTQMLARYNSDVAANYGSFDWLFMLGGTNDYDQSIPKETTLANLQIMALSALNAGKTVVLFAIFPRTGWGGDSGAQKTQGIKFFIWINQKLRNWVRTFAMNVPLYFVDAWADLSDPTNSATTGASLAIYAAAFQDGLHLNGLGGYLVGKRIKDVLPPLPQFPWRGRGAIDVYDGTDNPLGNLLANPCFFTTSGGTNSGNSVTAASGIPQSWTASQAMTGSGSFNAAEVTYTTQSAQSVGYDPTLGNIAQFSANIASGKGSAIKVNLQSAFVTSNVSIGDRIRAVARAKCTGLAGFAGAELALTYTPDGGATKLIKADLIPNGGFHWGQDDQTLTLVTPVLTVPNISQTTPDTWINLSAYFDATGATSATGTIQWSDVQMRKVA